MIFLKGNIYTFKVYVILEIENIKIKIKGYLSTQIKNLFKVNNSNMIFLKINIYTFKVLIMKFIR